MRGTVKFFNGAKGFGFITPEDGGTDVFVHISAVERAGLRGLDEGEQVEFEMETDRRSGKAAATDLRALSGGSGSGSGGGRSGGGPAANRYESGYGGGYGGGYASGGRSAPSDSGRSAQRSTASAGESGRGVVEWFNATKGFGFIQPSDGSGDVFVHISAVEQAGLYQLQEGQELAYEIQEDRRSGKASAANLRLER